MEGTMKIAKRLGHLRLTQSLEYLENGDMENWVKMMLQYYDKAYLFGLSQRNSDSVIDIAVEAADMKKDAAKIMDAVYSKEQLSM
jgi:tRNA 2-selenouridine synthase